MQTAYRKFENQFMNICSIETMQYSDDDDMLQMKKFQILNVKE